MPITSLVCTIASCDLRDDTNTVLRGAGTAATAVSVAVGAGAGVALMVSFVRLVRLGAEYASMTLARLWRFASGVVAQSPYNSMRF
jgi:hypothetical protein